MDPDVEPTLLRHPQVRAQPRRRVWARWDVQGNPCPPPAHSRSLSLQGTVVFTTHVPTLGRYAFLLHGYQPAHPTFAVEVLVNGGRIWQGEHIWQGGRGGGRRADSRPGARQGSLIHTAPCGHHACAQMVCGSRGPWHGACHLAVSDRSAHPSCRQFSKEMSPGPPSVQCRQPRLPAPP